MDDQYFYLFIYIIIILVAAVNVIISVSRLTKVSNGNSILDSEASVGVKMRKWFFLFLSILNLIRIITLVLDFRGEYLFIFHHLTIELWQKKFHFILRIIPTTFQLLTFSFLALYIQQIYLHLLGSSTSLFTYLWVFYCALILLSITVVSIMFLALSSSQKILNDSSFHDTYLRLLYLLKIMFILFFIYCISIFISLVSFTILIWKYFFAQIIGIYNYSKVLVRFTILSMIICIITFCMSLASTFELIRSHTINR